MQTFNKTGITSYPNLIVCLRNISIYFTFQQCNDYEIRLINTSNAYELSLRQKEQQLQEAHAHCEELSSRLNASHSRELQMIKDTKDNEIRELKIRIMQLQENVSQYFSHIYCLQVVLTHLIT